jgi:tetratricopeptide (TPR) repeat protein
VQTARPFFIFILRLSFNNACACRAKNGRFTSVILQPLMARELNSKDGESPGAGQWLSDAIFCLVCGLLVGIFTWFSDTSAPLETVFSSTSESPYNLLVQGFSAGQLNLKEEAPPGLAKLSDPYDPNLNAPYMGGALDDLTYYKGKLYIYFGVTPALVFFWPYFAVTGHYLSEKEAVAFFIGLGFAAIAGILRALGRRYFPETGRWIAPAGTIMSGLALALTLPVNFHEVVITCGFAFVMLALAAVWAALHDHRRRVLWLALASLAYGLALGARPSLLFGAVILLWPLLQARSQPAGKIVSRRMAALLLAAVGPIAVISLGLMLYNFLRFNNPFEFGLHYQLNTSYRPPSARLFGPVNFWFNFRLYFLEPVSLSRQFPFLKSLPSPPIPPGYDLGNVYVGGGALIIYPEIFFILALPLAWKRKVLESFTTACLLLFLAGAVTLCLYFVSSSTYELEFLPELLLLALIGTYCAGHAALPFPGRGCLLCFGWFLLMSYSVVFNFFANVESRAESDFFIGNFYLSRGQPDEAKAYFQKILTFFPDCADACIGLGNILFKEGRQDEAMPDYQKALEINPDYVEAHNNLGYCFLEKGRVDEAIAQFKKTVELRPLSVKYRNALGAAYSKKGLWDAAISQLEQSTKLEPDLPDAHNNLGYCFLQIGRIDEAIGQDVIAVKLEPTSASFLDNLGNALCQKGSFDKAVVEYKNALKVQPDYAEACNNLGYCLLRQGRLDDAIAQYEKATQLAPDSPAFRTALGNALSQKGKFDDAVIQYQKALATQPDSADVHESFGDALFQKGELDKAIVQYQAAVKLQPGLIQAHNNLGYCLQQTGRPDNAIAQYQKAIELEPGFVQAYNNLGNAWRQKKMAARAIDSYEKAIQIAPQFVPAQLNLAWTLATWPDANIRNGSKALALAERLDGLARGQNPKILRTLAAACAETGKFAEATSAAKQALALVSAQSEPALINALQTEIGLYLAHTPRHTTDNL